jgi:hypothetical protein
MSTLSTTNLKNASSGSNNIVLAADGSTTITTLTGTTITGTSVRGGITSGTAVASTSGTSIDFTSIPSWVKRVTVMFNGVSITGTANIRIQLGTGGVPTTTGYSSSVSSVGAGATSATATSGFDFYGGSTVFTFSGAVLFHNLSGNLWVCSGVFGYDASATGTLILAGKVTLGGVLNMLRVTTSNGTDTFDAGSINLLWEG